MTYINHPQQQQQKKLGICSEPKILSVFRYKKSTLQFIRKKKGKPLKFKHFKL